MDFRRSILTAIAVVASGLPPLTQPGRAARAASGLGKRYRAELHGFSICPPGGLERVTEPARKCLVRWVRRDEKSGRMLWSLEILKNRHRPNKAPAAEYAKQVAATLAKEEQFKVESIDVSVAALRPAMHFRGIWSGALQLWRRQTWVRLSDQEHLVLDVTGRMEDKQEMDAALSASLKTLRLFDPKAAIQERSESFALGAELLGGLTPSSLAGLLSGQTTYALVEREGRVVGFVKTTESRTSQSDARGVRVVRSGVVKLPDKVLQLMQEELFASFDRSVEQWRRVTVRREGKSELRTVEEGLKQRGVLLVHTTPPAGPRRTRQYVVPHAVRRAYLPAAFSVLLSRALDRSRPNSYGFAVFSSEAEDFHMRTVRVVGPAKIRAGGRDVPAVLLTDQASADADPSKLWVDDQGRLIEMRGAGGAITRRSDRRTIAARFAKELLELDALDK